MKASEWTESELEQALSSGAQESVRRIVQELPEDTVSLQWRSMLNERLRTLGPIKKRVSIIILGLRAAICAGAGVVVCFSVLALLKSREPNPSGLQQSNMAAFLLSEHRESVASAEIAGPGISDGEPERMSSADGLDQSESDLDSI